MNKSENNRLRLHAMLCDGMVLQRGADVKIWGWAKPAEQITVRFLNRAYRAVADPAGRWAVTLSRHEAGGPYEMTIEGDSRILLHDILIGDVWICSGQSNMQLPMERVKDQYADIVANADNPFIRQFDVPEQYDFKAPCENTRPGKWVPVSKDTILQFTAAGFFFAQQLYERYAVPIGLVKNAIGGAHLEAWMSRESLSGYPEKLQIADQFDDGQYVGQLMQREAAREKRWYEELNAADRGLRGACPWYAEDCDDAGWQAIPVPSCWADEGLGIINGALWFRKEITLPDSLAGQPARIFMGRIVDADEVYINGACVGTTAYRYPPRKYDVPAGLLKAGRNTIAVRVISNRGKGGFITDKPYRLIFGDRAVDLTGAWKYRIGAVTGALPDKTFLHQVPVGLFNGMLAPVSAYAVKGVIWYQGESNTAKPEEYEALFIQMIKAWRKELKQENLPFLFVQLPNYAECENEQAAGKWPLLRQAQMSALRVADTAMAVTIDIGEWNDLHPLNKRDVGRRLAMTARSVAYSERQAVAMGPVCCQMRVEDDKAVLSFAHVGSGLVSKDGDPLRCFEMAGDDGAFHEARASVAHDQVVVSCDRVRRPAAVRYAWSDCPRHVNFYNREGLPASPFIIQAEQG